jgi:hypothetical protein
MKTQHMLNKIIDILRSIEYIDILRILITKDKILPFTNYKW